jgi:hypothetical protein
MEDESYPKDLRIVYRNFPSLNISNTILIDNLYTNVIHFVNQKNSVLINTFDTLDYKDVCLRDVRKICKGIVRTAAIEDHVFSGHRIKRMGLEKYFNMFQTKQNVKMMNIGNTKETETFGTLKRQRGRRPQRHHKNKTIAIKK